MASVVFARPECSLHYEGSALQAADIYTKAFTVPAEWDKALRLINVLDPPRFWDGRGNGAKGHMGEEHKGGVKFSYRTSNPWRGSSSMSIPAPAVSATAASARK